MPSRPEPAESRDHGHSHDHGGGHDHGHDHVGGEDPPDLPTVLAADTPNPNARKFTASVTVIDKGSLTFNAEEEAMGHPLGRAIWSVGGVKGIFAVKDFVTVTRDPSADWEVLTPKLTSAIARALA
jgi:hypothetical protein